MRKVCKAKQVKIISYFFWRWIRHNYFTSLSISPNRDRWIISLQSLILYEHLISFTQSLRVLWIYASLRNAELVRKEEASYLRFFTHELKIRKFWISCCDCSLVSFARVHWTTNAQWMSGLNAFSSFPCLAFLHVHMQLSTQTFCLVEGKFI